LTSQDTGRTAGNDRVTGITSGNQSASRIGFKGTEDLGNGLKANFVLESGFQADTGTTGAGQTFGFGDRISTVGLSGGFGAINVGRQTTALKDGYDQIDPFGDGGTIAPISRAFFGGNQGNGRINNSVKYSSNNYSGFKFTANYGFGETVDSVSNNSAYGVGLGYANGPLNVQFGYNNRDNTNAAAAAVFPGPGTPGSVAVTAADGETTAIFLGATYNFNVVKLHAAYGEGKTENFNVDTAKNRSAMLGLSVPVGPGTLIGSYTVNDNRLSTVDADTQIAAIMYTYDLSKRTNLYTGYSHTSNDANARINTVNLDQSGSFLAVGVRHKF
jgi:predicted porin